MENKPCENACSIIGSPHTITKEGFSILSSSIMDGDGIWNFASIIVRNDNPHLKEIAAEFMETVNLLSSNSK